MHCEHVGGHHDQHRDVEGEEGAQQEEMPVRHLASEQRDDRLKIQFTKTLSEYQRHVRLKELFTEIIKLTNNQQRDLEGEERAQQEEMPVRHLASEQRDARLKGKFTKISFV